MDTDLEKSTYSAFERLLYYFFIPLVFTLVLLGALLSLFDYNVKNQVLKVANKIPLVASVVPDPKLDTTSAEPGDAKGSAGAASAMLNQAVSDLKKQLANKDAALKKAQADASEKDQEMKDLQTKLESLQNEQNAKAKSDEEYAATVKATADIFAKMTPSKAAPVMENLTLKEQVLMLGAMKTDDQVRILEKMDPKKAAEASISLKDAVPAKDQEIAALQERLKLNAAEAKTTQKMTKTDLAQTVAKMTPKSAASLLIELEKTSPAKVTDIMNSMDSASRSSILSAISDNSQTIAAEITARLAQ